MNGDCQRGARKAGLTLIEVVLAALLLSVGMTALLVAASRCLAVIKRAAIYQSGQWVLGTGEAEHPIDEETEDPEEDWRVEETEYPENFTFAREVMRVRFMGRKEESEGTGPCLVGLHSRVDWGGSQSPIREEAIRLVFRKECPWK
ncbi:MAG: type IV pilus modification PilV family protein [Kiritimatiellia bacterium]